jgi:carboxyl-terminal processing protease
VTLTILHSRSGRTRDVPLTRAAITLQNVTWQRLPGSSVVHVRLAGFTQGVTETLRSALESIKGDGISGVILDLRNNPGGLLDEAIGVASLFIKEGNVLLEKDAQGKVSPVPVRPGAVAPELPVAVLVNRGSASASEIVAGAMRDVRNATLVGETTFGTGTVLNAYGLSDGSALLLAFKEWLTPNGETIWRKGITPAVVVSLPADVAPLSPEGERGMSPQEFQETRDEQLQKALELLGGITARTAG